ncbi:YDG domain-containing protein, partial [Pedobacter nyackensis]
YTVTITDANGCTATRNYSITQPSAISTATGSQTNVSCNGGTNGSASVSPSGGTPGYTYSWSPSGGTAATATGLAAGSYTVTITDANGCTATRNYSITQPSPLVVSPAQVNVTTAGGSNGSATVTVTGGTPGYTYSWLPSGGTAATASGLTAGAYTCTITDANGCTATKTFNIIQPVVLTGFPDINKAYGATTFTLTNPVSASAGAFSYTSSNNSIAAISGQNVTIIKPGTVTITATQAANGNYDTSSITATLNIAAKDISLTLNPAPSINKTYDGNDNATLASGNYQLIGLEGTDEVLVSFTAKYENKNAGTGKTVTVSNIALSGAQKDYYHLTTITATVTGSITPKPLTATATTVTKVYDGTDAAIVAFNPYNAVSGLLTGDNVSTGYASAVYSNKNVAANKPITINGLNLTGTDKNNYSLNAFSTTGSITPKPLTITADNKEKFAGTANPTLTASYTAFAANEDNSVLTTQPVITTLANVNSPIGTYDINVSGAASANYSIDYVKGILTIKPGAPSSITLAGVTLFENKTAGTNAGTLSSTSDDPSATFTYSLVAGTGDTDNALFAISANKINTAASLNFENKASYSIRVKCITQHGLSLEKTFTIALSDVNEIPTLATVANQSICYTKTAQTVALSGISAGHETAQTTTLTVSSSNANLFENLTVTGSGATANVNYKAKTGASGTATITVTVKDNGGVADGGVDTYSSTFVITINALPIVAINSDKGPQVSKGEAVILNATGGASYAWTAHSSILSSLNSASLTVRPSETTTYTVTATNASGCTETQTFTITVLDDLVKVKATNIMSPNGDGVNDNWVIENLDMYPNNEVRIFTRAGRLVYSKKGYDNSWDATLNGAPLAEGTYYYIVDFGPNKTKVKGFITITRPN